MARIWDSFRDERTRAAIRHVVRAVVDWRGQVITVSDRAYLTAAMPMCVVWGEDDMVIPVDHARTAAEVAPGARVELLPNCGHFPHRDHPERFVKVLQEFVRRSEPARHSTAAWRAHLRTGGLRVSQAEAGHAPVHPVVLPSA